MASYWLFKSEPETYSFAQLLKDKKTNWDHVRNFQARKFLSQAAKGDLALIYHSGDDKAVVGIAEVVREAYPDPDPEKPGDWVQIDLKPVEALDRPISLKEIKSTPSLATLPLIRQSRLSCMPVTSAHFETIVRLSKKPAESDLSGSGKTSKSTEKAKRGVRAKTGASTSASAGRSVVRSKKKK